MYVCMYIYIYIYIYKSQGKGVPRSGVSQTTNSLVKVMWGPGFTIRCPMRVSDAGRGMSRRVAGVRCMSGRVARDPS